MTLAALAAKYGTDKGHVPVRGLTPKGYVDHYEALLRDRRDEPLRLLEIGVRTGASLRMWEEYLPKARIIGIDIAPCEIQASERVTVVVGHQAHALTLDVAVKLLGGGLDIVVDDGSHRTVDQMASFRHLMPKVDPRGWYAIEDLHASPATRPWLESLASRYRVSFPTPSLAIVRALE